MSVDPKRIQGPEKCYPYSLYVSKEESYDVMKNRIISENGVREDGRKCDQQRKIYMKTGVVSQAKGSAYIEMNNTKVICSVFDPREIPRKSDYSVNGELFCEFKFCPFSCEKRRGHQPDWEEKQYSLVLRRALEPAVCRHEFPNFQVDVYVLVLENDGSVLAAAINCAGLALADASVPMYDLVSAASMGIHGEVTFLDPSAEEEELCNVNPPEGQNKNHGLITVAYLSCLEQISEFAQTGLMSVDSVTDGIKLLTKACEATYPLAQQCIIKNVAKCIRKKKDS